MIIYLDVVLIENLCMNCIILFATAYVLKIKRNHIRIVISALLGGIYSILAYVGNLKIYSNIIAKIILSVLMIFIAYMPKSWKQIIKEILIFYLVSFLFGGCAFALLYIVKPQEVLIKNGILIGTYPLKIAILGGLMGFALVSISFYIVKSKLSKKNIYCNLTIFFEEKEQTMKALIDSGNMLKEPVSNLPVIIVEKSELYNIIPKNVLMKLEQIIGGDDIEELYQENELKFINRIRTIPFKSIGKENGMLLGFKLDRIKIENEDNVKEINNVIIGIYDNKLSKDLKYSALVGLDLIERNEKNEFFTNTY